MSNLTTNTSLRQVSSGPVAEFQVPVFAAAKPYMGAMICLLTASGYAVRAGTAATGRVVGIAKAEAAAPTASGDNNVNLLTGQFIRPCHATHTPTIADVMRNVYASDDQTISNDPSDGPLAGTLVGFEATSGDAIFYVEPPSAAELSWASKEISLFSPGILAAGTPMAAFANQATSDPGSTLVDSEGAGIRWNNAASQIAVWTGFMMPDDLDTSKDASLVFKASKTGATSGDATKFTVTLFNNATGALHDADTDFGGDTSAMTGAATAKTVQEVTLTLTAADLAAGEHVSMSFKPKDGTLGTDDVVLFGVKLRYRRKS